MVWEKKKQNIKIQAYQRVDMKNNKKFCVC